MYIYSNNISKKSVLRVCMSLVLMCMVLTPIIDSLTGYLMSKSGGETMVSKIFRMFFLFILLLIMIKTLSKKKILLLYSFILYVIMLPALYMLLNNSTKGFISDELYLSKLFFPIMYIIAFNLLNRKGYPVEEVSIHLLRYFSLIYPILVIVPTILGISAKSYGEIGIKGFFSSGNESSIILSTMFIVNYAFMKKKITVFNIIATIISAIVGFLTASKAVIIIYILFFCFIVFKKQKNKIINVVMIGIIFILFIYIVNHFFYNQIIIFMERMQFRYNQLGNSFWDTLFSYRNRKILPNFKNNYLDINGFFYLVFGRGAYYHIYATKYSDYVAASGLIEMDFFDVLLQNGLILFFIVTIFYGRILTIKTRDEIFTLIKFTYFVMILFSFMAGHVLYSPLSGTILALLGSILMVHSRNYKNNFKGILNKL